MAKVKIVCGWCNKPLGEKDGHGVEGECMGICDKCLQHRFPHHANKIIKTLGSEKERYRAVSNIPR